MSPGGRAATLPALAAAILGITLVTTVGGSIR
jgi:hypothetical protein